MNSMPHTDARTRRPAPEGSRGFTLLETVIALAVMLVVGFGAISLFLFSVNYNAGASDRARALAIAQQRIETLRSAPYAGLANGDTTANVNAGSTAAGESDRRTFAVRTVIENTGGVNNARQKTITVTVTPNATGGRMSIGGVMLRTYRSSTLFEAP